MASFQPKKEELDLTDKNPKQSRLKAKQQTYSSKVPNTSNSVKHRPRKPHTRQTQSMEKLGESLKNLTMGEKQQMKNSNVAENSNVDYQESRNTAAGIRSEQDATSKKRKKRSKPNKTASDASPSVETEPTIENLYPAPMNNLKDSGGNTPANRTRQRELKVERNVNKLKSCINSARKTPVKKTENSEVLPRPEPSDTSIYFSKDEFKEEQRKPVVKDSNSVLKTPLPSLQENHKSLLPTPETNTENDCSADQNSPEKAMQSPSIVTHSEADDTVRLTIWPAPPRPKSPSKIPSLTQIQW